MLTSDTKIMVNVISKHKRFSWKPKHNACDNFFFFRKICLRHLENKRKGVSFMGHTKASNVWMMIEHWNLITLWVLQTIFVISFTKIDSVTLATFWSLYGIYAFSGTTTIFTFNFWCSCLPDMVIQQTKHKL